MFKRSMLFLLTSSLLAFVSYASPVTLSSLTNILPFLFVNGDASSSHSTHLNQSNVNVFETYNISSPDGSIHLSIIPLGAAVTNLFVKDRDGNFRDVILGYDNRTEYLTDPSYPYFGPVVGRYANRIRNSSFSIPPHQNLDNAPKESIYHVTPNENEGQDTLHGGITGTSRSGFTLLSHKPHEIVFGLLDKDGVEGFPGNVFIKVNYTLTNDATWTIKFDAHAFELSPILLSSHVYWNLDGYQGSSYDNSSLDAILDHELFIKSNKFIEIDGIEVPTGILGDISSGSALDFNEARAIGERFNETLGFCGTGCTGYDNAWIYADHTVDDTVLTLASPSSGIKLSIKTDQLSAQVYTCNGQHGAIPRKANQGNGDYDQFSCIVLEQQGYIGGINQPQWKQDQVYGPEREYTWWSEYSFSTFE